MGSPEDRKGRERPLPSWDGHFLRSRRRKERWRSTGLGGRCRLLTGTVEDQVAYVQSARLLFVAARGVRPQEGFSWSGAPVALLLVDTRDRSEVEVRDPDRAVSVHDRARGSSSDHAAIHSVVLGMDRDDVIGVMVRIPDAPASNSESALGSGGSRDLDLCHDPKRLRVEPALLRWPKPGRGGPIRWGRCQITRASSAKACASRETDGTSVPRS
jgi:hypothetical protein